MPKSIGTTDNNFKLIFSNLNLAQRLVKMLLKELMNIEVEEKEITIQNPVIEGKGDGSLKEYIMDARFDVGKKYIIDIEMQNYFNVNRENTLKRMLDYLTQVATIYKNQRKSTTDTIYMGICFANCKINKDVFVDMHEMINIAHDNVINYYKVYTIDFTKIDKCDNIVLREFVEVLTSDARYKYKGRNKLMEDLLYEIYGTTLSAQQIEANIRRQRNIEYEQDLIKNSKEEGKKEGKIEGIKLGKKEGKLEGQKENQKEIIKKSLSKGKTLEEIADFLDLSIGKLNSILKEEI